MKLSKKDLKISSLVGGVLFLLGIAGIFSISMRTESCVPYNVFLSKGGDNIVEISWNTRDACLGYALYGDSPYEIERVAINPDNLGKEKKHKVTISNLLSTNAYYFIIVSDEQPYGNDGSAVAFYLDNIK